MIVRKLMTSAFLLIAATATQAGPRSENPSDGVTAVADDAMIHLEGSGNPETLDQLIGNLRTQTDADLRETGRERGIAVEAVRYRQYYQGMEIVGAGVVVSVSDGLVRSFDAEIARPAAAARAFEAGRAKSLATMRANDPSGTREVLLLIDGNLVRSREVRVSETPLKESLQYFDTRGSLLLTIPLWFESEPVSVFRSNPVTSLNNPGLRDEDDSPAAVPANAYRDENLDLAPGAATLSTARVRVNDLELPATLATDPSSSLRFDRGDPRFEEVMAVWHIDRSLAYLEGLGYTGTSQIVTRQISVDAHGGNGSDNSFYAKRSDGPVLVFGDGGVDDAEDPDIILHELGHAIHDGIAPSILSGTPASDARAVSEGFADYWAFSEGWAESIVGSRDPFCIGDWDARCGSGPSSGCSYPAGADCLRRTDSNIVYGQLDRSGRSGSEHQNGRMWSSLLRELFLDLRNRYGDLEGKRRADTLVLEGMVGLPFMPRFNDMVEHLLDADDAIYGAGAHSLICRAAQSRGIETSRCPAPWNGSHTVFPGGGAPIPADGLVRSTHWVPQQGTVLDLRVSVQIEHPDLRNIEISIMSPDRTELVLARRGSLEGTSVSMLFGLDAPSSEPLLLFDGRELLGEWSLLVRSFGSQTGVLNGWSLTSAIEEDSIPASREEAGQRFVLIPAAGHTPGANGTHWVTDLNLRNLTSSPQRFFMVLTPAGTDGNESALLTRILIEPAQTLTIRDVARSIFAFEGACSIELRGQPGVVSAISRTYNDAASGTFGQSIPAYEGPMLSSDEPELFLPALRETIEFRSNAGFTESAGEKITVFLDVFGSEGDLLGSVPLSFLPWEHRQISIRNVANNFPAGLARIRYVSGKGSLAAYASIIDNRTGDPIYLPAVRSEHSDSRIIPAVAHLDGVGGSKWRSDVYLSNPTDTAREIAIEFRSSSGTSFRSISGTLGPFASAFVPDVVPNWFGVFGAGQLEIIPGDIIVSSRTWNDGGVGSFGQHVPSVRRSQGISVIGRSGVAIGIEQSANFRTNIGLVEIDDDFAVFDVTVYGQTGAMLCTSRFGLAPREQRQVALPSMGCKSAPGGYAVLTKISGGGSVVGWASIVDNRSGDPVYVPITAEGAE